MERMDEEQQFPIDVSPAIRPAGPPGGGDDDALGVSAVGGADGGEGGTSRNSR